ncbi:MAG: AAA family ATPase [Bacillota bacterium]
MHYKNIYIRDFGIFANQHLNKLSKNIVVIGGKNRAGKSTFLKLMQYLPFGLTAKNSLPQAKNEYYIEVDLERKNKDYNLNLTGFSAPKIKDKKHKNYDPAQIFNNLDPQSYQQLYTISLNELQSLAQIAKGKKEKKSLYSLLLGAGISELSKIPELAAKYFKQAKTIGGILGDPAVASFKPYFKEIKAGQDLRAEALLEVSEFKNKRELLVNKKAELANIKTKIKENENKYILVDLLMNNYKTLQQIEAIKLEIKKQSNYQTDNTKTNLKLEQKLKNLINFIQANKEKITNYNQKIKFLDEKIENYYFIKEKINKKYDNLILDLKEINSNWKAPFTNLEAIKLDLIKEKKLTQNLNLKTKLAKEIEELKNKITELKTEIEVKENKLLNFKRKAPAVILKKTYFILFISFLILALSLFLNYDQIKYFSLISLLTAYIYYASNYKNAKFEAQNKKDLKIEIKHKNTKLNDLNLELASKIKEKKQIKAYLTEIAKKLGLDLNSDFYLLASYFKEIKTKKRSYQNLKLEEKENEKEKENLKSELNKIYNFTQQLNKYLNSDFDFNLSKANYLSSKSQILLEKLALANKLKELVINYQTKKDQISYSLNAAAEIKKALNNLIKNKNNYQALVKFKTQFADLGAVEKENKNIVKTLTKLKARKEKLEEKITTLKNKIKELSTSAKLEQAQTKISSAQNDLEKKADRYALNQTTKFLLKKLRSEMIKKAEKELLKPATDILNQISELNYQKLETTADFTEQDFKLKTKAGKKITSIKELSQGSLEQLFLALRISRIKEIKPSLPLFLDDALVNFDSQHLYNTLNLIATLAQKHQIFILTCHPKLISYLAEISNSIQFWKLDSGKFELSSSQKLFNYLSL